MKSSSKQNIWNRRKGEINNKEEELENDLFLNDEEKMNEMIPRIQQRLGVSREEARNIIRNSELL